MKRNILTAWILFLLLTTANAGNLLDVYKSGTVRLIPDNTFAQDNDWNSVFRSYKDSLGSSHIGARKSLVILPDGSIIVNHTYKNYYSKFNAQGKFVKEFNLKTTKGAIFKKTQPIEGVINGNTLFTGVDNVGNLYCMNNNGMWLKTLKIDYSVRQLIPLPNRKFALVGWKISDDYISEFVAFVNYDDGKQKIIWERKDIRDDSYKYPNAVGLISKKERPLFQYGYYFPSGGGIGYSLNFDGASSIKSTPIIAFSNNRLIVALSDEGDIMEYDLNGKLVKKGSMSWAGEKKSVEEIKAELRKEIESFKSKRLSKARAENTEAELQEAKAKFLKEMEEDYNRISEPMLKPSLSTVIKDSDGNLLFFEYPKEKNQNLFHVWVYENGGRFVCKSQFVCDEYELVINPSRMVFRNGYLYSVQKSKTTRGIPMRLVRFKLVAE